MKLHFTLLCVQFTKKLLRIYILSQKFIVNFFQGTYTTSGINLKELEDHNSPKVYFYGKYKLLFKIKNVENKVITCGVLEFRLLRPWENPLVI